jgi:hypothetical protein
MDYRTWATSRTADYDRMANAWVQERAAKRLVRNDDGDKKSRRKPPISYEPVPRPNVF